MHTEDEKKVVAYSRGAMLKRAEFFNEAAKRHPEVAEHFNALADATRDMAKLVYVEPGQEDPALAKKVAEAYGPGLRAVMLAGLDKPALLEELQESQRVVARALDEAEAKNPELVPVREALQRKNNVAPK